MLDYNTLRSRRLQPIGTETMWLRAVVRRVADTGDMRLNLDPDYQRGRVWTDDQAARFIGFLAEGGTAPPVFVQRWRCSRRGPTPPDEVLDGKQRLTAMLRFAAGEIPMETAQGERAYLSDFSDEDQSILWGTAGLRLDVQMVQCETREQVLALYLRLNRGGTPHSDAEIDRVRDLLRMEGA